MYIAVQHVHLYYSVEFKQNIHSELRLLGVNRHVAVFELSKLSKMFLQVFLSSAKANG